MWSFSWSRLRRSYEDLIPHLAGSQKTYVNKGLYVFCSLRRFFSGWFIPYNYSAALLGLSDAEVIWAFADAVKIFVIKEHKSTLFTM